MTIEATIDGQLVRWRDSKRYLWIMGAIIPLIPMAMWGLYVWTGSTLSWFFAAPARSAPVCRRPARFRFQRSSRAPVSKTWCGSPMRA